MSDFRKQNFHISVSLSLLTRLNFKEIGFPLKLGLVNRLS